MRKFLVSLFVLLLAVSPVLSDSPDELAAISQTAYNYMDAWYKGDKKE